METKRRSKHQLSKIAILLFMALLLPQVTQAQDYDFKDGNFCYEINEDGKSVTLTYDEHVKENLIGEIVIPSSVSFNGETYTVLTIGKYAFRTCEGLTGVTIPNSVIVIDKEAFYGCSSLNRVTIPNSVIRIGACAFELCGGLTSITIPNSVTKIDGLAFSFCSGLTNIIISKSVTEIGHNAFYGCPNLTSIVVEKGNKVYDSRYNCNAIVETASNTLILGCNNTTMPNSITAISFDAFRGCTGLNSISIPNSVTKLGSYAFDGCAGLTSVTIPNSVTIIGNDTFKDCSSLTSITIPNLVTVIGVCAFKGCTGLTSIHSQIDDPTKCEMGILVFENVDKDKCTLYVPPKSIGLYKKAEQWRDFKNIKVETGTSSTQKGNKGTKKRNRHR